jgi:hypothetical protein
MFHFLIGLAVATVLIVGCLNSSVLAVVFVTLLSLFPFGLGLLMLSEHNTAVLGGWLVVGGVVLCGLAWLPTIIRVRMLQNEERQFWAKCGH